MKVMILVAIPRYVGLSTADIAKNYSRVTVLLQYVPRIIRFVPLLGGRQSATGFIFESAWANFVINLLMFVMAGHVVGSCWYLFGLQVRLFTLMDWPILDAICDKLRQKLYISGSDILYQGGPVDKMVFIVRGKLESISADGIRAPLHDGDVCGEELLTWYLEHSSANKAASNRYESPCWRTIAAALIQVAWKYRKRRLMRAERSRTSERT
uniref:Uncharacterized protein n=1 Tax=Avena sativa TaxID=4498 RepID=A0ACD5YX60_AVESA